MRVKLPLLSSLIVTLLVLSMSGAPALAQTEAPASPPLESVESPSIPEYQTEYNRLTSEYQSQLDVYRKTEREFSIFKEQFSQLKTLASLEKAVMGTRVVMQARGQVLDTYLTRVALILENTLGVPESERTQVLSSISETQNLLKTQNEKLKTSDSRDKIAGHVQVFDQLYPLLIRDSYQALALIQFGRLRDIQLRTNNLVLTLESDIQNDSNLSQDVVQRKLRGITEIRKLLDSNQTSLDEWYGKLVSNFEDANSNWYNQQLKEANITFAQLSRIHLLVAEAMGVVYE